MATKKEQKISFDEKVFWLALRYGAVKYIPISTKNYFLFFKIPFVLVRHGQKQKTKYKCGFYKFDPRECAIVHQRKIYIRWQGNYVDKYLRNYKDKINKAPLFLVSNIIGTDKIKITSPTYLTPLKIIFRRVGLLKENVGKNKKINIIREHLRNYVIRESMSKKQALAELADAVAKEADRLFPENADLAADYYWSPAHISRILNAHKAKMSHNIT
ncbi:MAG: hypothetical protein PHI59_01670 [Candidatus Omnitrophica bacterium]|nr:hypothetical protein [Candidatus Omnitrophota bacterium]